MRDRLRLAVPNKGRLVEPTLALLHDAGLVFEEHDRSLVARVQNLDLDILFVRTSDIVEFVGDGVADLGITGRDLLAETGSALPVTRALGYGRCRLAVAVPSDSPLQAVEDLAGLRIATAHPNVTRAFLREREVPAEIIALSGAVEVAPRLGLAEAIVDLVSTGSTLAMNGLRAIGDVLESEAVLVANAAATSARVADVAAIDTMIGAVIAARGRKYVMMNAPATHLAELEAAASRARVAVGHPAGARGDDRHPRGRDHGRRLGTPPAPQGSRRVGDPRPADREDRPMSPAGGATDIRLRRLDLRAAGAAAARDPELTSLARRGAVPDAGVRSAALEILAAVERDGAAAVVEAGLRFGGGLADGRLVLDREELEAAAGALDGAVRTALDAAIDNVRRFAERQRPASTVTEIVRGVEIQRRWVPVTRVGAYVPGGAAAYPSSLLMTVVPARVARAGSVVVASPAGPDGMVNPVLLGAAGLLGIDALIVAGGAQAIGALAFGLPALGIEPADLVVGPGNAWVTAAKLGLAGRTAIDLPAGPSEGMVLGGPPGGRPAGRRGPADPGRARPRLAGDPRDDRPQSFADAVAVAMTGLLSIAPRGEILARSLADHGRVILVADLEAAVDVVNAYAPEHLSVDVPDVETVVGAIRNAGSVFVGPWAPESAGDYATGANHVLPTGGLARGCGALSVETFGKFIQVQRITKDGLRVLRPTIGALARAEGLFAHAQAVDIRFRDETGPGGKVPA